MVDELRVRTMLDRLGIEIDALHRLATRDSMELLGDDDLLACSPRPGCSTPGSPRICATPPASAISSFTGTLVVSPRNPAWRRGFRGHAWSR
jgi:hypothetical protein